MSSQYEFANTVYVVSGHSRETSESVIVGVSYSYNEASNWVSLLELTNPHMSFDFTAWVVGQSPAGLNL